MESTSDFNTDDFFNRVRPKRNFRDNAPPEPEDIQKNATFIQPDKFIFPYSEVPRGTAKKPSGIGDTVNKYAPLVLGALTTLYGVFQLTAGQTRLNTSGVSQVPDVFKGKDDDGGSDDPFDDGQKPPKE